MTTFLCNQHLVFMPGLDGTGRSFDPLLSLLPPDSLATIVRYPTDRHLTLEETAQCAAEQIPAGTSPVVIAESFSGPVAVRMVASGLVRARALVLCATFARPPRPLAWRVLRLLRIPVRLGRDIPRPLLRWIMVDNRHLTTLLPLWEKVHADVPPQTMHFRLELMNRLDVTGDLEKITVPCLYLQAANDRVAPGSCLRDFEQNIPHLRVKKIQGPHFILQAAPQESLEAINEFLGGTVGAARSDAARRASAPKDGAFFRALVENAADVTVVINAKAAVTYVHPSVKDILGYFSEELLGKNAFDYVAPGDKPQALLAFGKAIPIRNARIAGSVGIRHKNGSIRIFEGACVNLLYDPAVQGFVLCGRDVTERRRGEEELAASHRRIEELIEKRTADLSLVNDRLTEEQVRRRKAENALGESEEKFRDFLDYVPLGVCTLDLSGRILSVNRRIEDLMGWSLQDVIGKDGFALAAFDDQTRTFLQEKFLTRIKGQARQAFEIPVTVKDGGRIWLQAITTPVKKDGATVGVQVVFVNLEERKREEERRKALMEQLHRTEKMESLATLAGGVAHELNSVLGVLVGHTELMMMKMPDDHPLKKNLHTIMKFSKAAAAIIQDMQILAGRGVTVSSPLNLNRLIRNALQTPEFQRLKAGCPRVVLSDDLAENLLSIQGSPVYLEKTVYHLIANAFDAIAENGEITIRTANSYLDRPLPGYIGIREGDYVTLTVHDNGKSLSANDIRRIFEPFYTKKILGKGGTGLGLAVVWGTVREHRGYISVQSGKEKGNAFTVYLPAAREAAKTPAPGPAPEAPAGKGETILLVDDLREQREIAASLLTRLGYSVRTAAGGEEALAALKKHPAALVVLDMLMEPGIDGLETYRRMLEINPQQKAIIVSGYTETDRVQQALAMGASAYVRKPYLLDDIGAAIRKALAGS
ncbi:MAG: PAS domain S-box protein [Smithellaceae bacterium]|nr:PAS domain S-box protein [Syntrophaceae bacterium]MDD4241252.1 PAS domain S-box protein [Smithellaceae bacterium]NLX52514.1 PAS domain S-box protein [Deltaproteobacteria bacterium]